MVSSPAYAEHPHHKIEVGPETTSARVTFAGRVVAESTRARVLHESRCPPRVYIPAADVDQTLLERTSHTTWCGFKGNASYYSLRVGDEVAENAVWTYEDPFDEVTPIGNHLAFWGDKLTIEHD
jgi:uncharacterized protein (DUF427 family)